MTDISFSSLKDIYRMSDDDAWELFCELKYTEKGFEGVAKCPWCGDRCPYYRPSRGNFKCLECSKDYTLTSGTILSGSRLKKQDIIASAFLFCSGAKGISSIQAGKTLGTTQKAIFILFHKFREAIGEEVQSFTKLKDTIDKSAIIQGDETRAWNSLEKLYTVMRIKHSFAFSSNSASTNNAESFFSRMRKCHSGTHHKIDGENLLAYANEMAWKSDFHECSVEELTKSLLSLCLNASKSKKWSGYWQKSKPRHF